jgi:Mrp family chromosome partitioning ATPase
VRSRRAVLAATLAAMLSATCLSACQTLIQKQQAKVEAEHKIEVKLDTLRLMVYTSDLNEPYDKLGELSYTDPLNGDTIDTEHINEKLRQMAIARWGTQVDAIILVTTKVGGTDQPTITVTGEAIRMKGACSGCRHNFPMPKAE